ncbi:hypothetical protein ACFV0T_39030 [Streptomyces sp. NPDC059582]|uniref:hypothetical protein n=1 Tax=Streptomyces sp. NPDC059582 TaxID=3346875 RepID=UPI0036ADE666
MAAEHAVDAADFELVDLMDFALPLLDEPVPARGLVIARGFRGLRRLPDAGAARGGLHGLVDELLAWARALGPLRAASRCAGGSGNSGHVLVELTAPPAEQGLSSASVNYGRTRGGRR